VNPALIPELFDATKRFLMGRSSYDRLDHLIHTLFGIDTMYSAFLFTFMPLIGSILEA